MRWLALLVLILAAAPARAQEDEAEKFYRAMEKKVLAAESLALEFNSQNAVGDEKFTIKGTIYIAAGNKTRLDLESELFQLGGKTLIVTNGKSKYSKVGNLLTPAPPMSKHGRARLLPGRRTTSLPWIPGSAGASPSQRPDIGGAGVSNHLTT